MTRLSPQDTPNRALVKGTDLDTPRRWEKLRANVDGQIYDRLMALAARRGTSLAELTRHFLAEGLDRAEAIKRPAHE